MNKLKRIWKLITNPRSLPEVEAESRQWKFECDCGHKFSVWDIGGVRCKAKSSSSYKTVRCPHCQKVAMRKLFKEE